MNVEKILDFLDTSRSCKEFIDKFIAEYGIEEIPEKYLVLIYSLFDKLTRAKQ